MNDLISIIMPTYNAEDSIARAIDSVLKQTYSNWDLIIIDDGSFDRTKKIISSYIGDRRIKYFFKSNEGVSKAREFGLKKADGKYITFLDSDDFFYPDRLEKMLSCFVNEDVDLVYTSFTVTGGGDVDRYLDINECSKKILDSKDFIDDILFTQKMTCLWRGLFRSSIAKNIHFRCLNYAEDYFYLLDYALACRKIIKIGNSGYCYVTGNNKSLTSSSMQSANFSFFVAIPIDLNCYLNDNGFYGKRYEKKIFHEYLRAIKRIIRFCGFKKIPIAKRKWKSDFTRLNFSLGHAKFSLFLKLLYFMIFL